LSHFALERLLEALDIPHLLNTFRRHMETHDVVQHLAPDGRDAVGNIVNVHEAVTLLVDDLALVVRDVVEFEQLLADVEVPTLDLALGIFDGAGDPGMLDRLTLLHAEFLHEPGNAVRTEDPHQAVVERQVKPGGAGIALAPGAPTQLIVDPARFVSFGTNHVQTPGRDHLVVATLPIGPDALVLLGRRGGQFLLEISAQHDVGTPTGHVGGDGHGPGPSGLGDDLRLPLVLLRVEHLMGDAELAQDRGQLLRGLDRGGSHQHGLAAPDTLADIFDDRLVFFGRRAIDLVRGVLPDHGHVRRDHDHFEPVDVLELVGLGVGGAGHARQLLVQPEIILKRDRGERLVLVLDAHTFLGLDRLVQAVRPAPAGHHAPGKLVDDDDLVVLDDVIHLAPEQRMGPQRGVQVMEQHDVGRVVQVAALRHQSGIGQQPLGRLMSRFGQERLARLFIDRVVSLAALALLALEAGNDGVDAGVKFGDVLGRPGDDERRARLVDQDRVHLVDDGVVKTALHPVLGAKRHVVAQVVEPKLVVGAVCDIGAVGRVLLRLLLLGEHDPDAQAQEPIHPAHPFGVAPGQVVVHRDHVHAAPRQGVEVGGKSSHQRLAFARAHLANLALIERDAADHLHVEVTHPEGAARGLAHHREGLGAKRLQALAGLEPTAKFLGLGAQRLVAQRLQRRLEGIDGADLAPVLAQQPRVAVTNDLAEEIGDHQNGPGRTRRSSRAQRRRTL